jgi:hypothetical protein
MRTKLCSFRFPEDKHKQLKEIAERKHDDNLTQALMEAIDRYYAELHPPRLQGYIQIDHIQDLNSDEECPGCEKSIGSGAWIAVYSNGTVKGVICDECVEAGRG